MAHHTISMFFEAMQVKIMVMYSSEHSPRMEETDDGAVAGVIAAVPGAAKALTPGSNKRRFGCSSSYTSCGGAVRAGGRAVVGGIPDSGIDSDSSKYCGYGPDGPITCGSRSPAGI